jgi:hypothetical protein
MSIAESLKPIAETLKAIAESFNAIAENPGVNLEIPFPITIRDIVQYR